MTKTIDRIIELADGLGYGVDIDFTGRKPIKIKPLRGATKTFSTPEGALSFLQERRAALVSFA